MDWNPAEQTENSLDNQEASFFESKFKISHFYMPHLKSRADFIFISDLYFFSFICFVSIPLCIWIFLFNTCGLIICNILPKNAPFLAVVLVVTIYKFGKLWNLSKTELMILLRKFFNFFFFSVEIL